MGYPPERLRQEIAFLAYYLHWDYETVMQLEHTERQQWCAEVSQIHKNLNDSNTQNEISLEI